MEISSWSSWSCVNSWHILVQIKQWTLQNNMWNLFAINNKDTRMMSFFQLWLFEVECDLIASKAFQILGNYQYCLLYITTTSLIFNLVILISITAWKVSLFGVVLVRIFPRSDWMQRDTEYLSVFSPITGKYGPE